MRKRYLQWMICLGVMLMTSSAMAFALSTGFEGVTISQTTNLTTTSGLNQWNDLVRWQINPTGGVQGAWAQQTPNPTGGDETSLLFYGFDASGLGAGTPFSLQFDFINSGRGRVYLGGLDAGESISRFAPWGDLSTTNFFSAPLATASQWTSASYAGTVLDNYDVLYLAFEMGGTSGLRGIDNLSLYVGSNGNSVPAPVPEPSAFLLLGAGLGALALWRRRKIEA